MCLQIHPYGSYIVGQHLFHVEGKTGEDDVVPVAVCRHHEPQTENGGWG